MRPSERIMYIERKGNDGLVGAARIGRAQFSRSGKSVHYNGQTFQTKSGSGFKSNYFDVETGEDYWISGCKKNGEDALYSTEAIIDEDVREEYWVNIRCMPENMHISKIRVKSKY
ncbi:MAG: hypothetical protein ABW168_05005 [Sedimenticola sp.]